MMSPTTERGPTARMHVAIERTADQRTLVVDVAYEAGADVRPSALLPVLIDQGLRIHKARAWEKDGTGRIVCVASSTSAVQINDSHLVRLRTALDDALDGEADPWLLYAYLLSTVMVVTGSFSNDVYSVIGIYLQSLGVAVEAAHLCMFGSRFLAVFRVSQNRHPLSGSLRRTIARCLHSKLAVNDLHVSFGRDVYGVNRHKLPAAYRTEPANQRLAVLCKRESVRDELCKADQFPGILTKTESLDAIPPMLEPVAALGPNLMSFPDLSGHMKHVSVVALDDATDPASGRRLLVVTLSFGSRAEWNLFSATQLLEHLGFGVLHLEFDAPAATSQPSRLKLLVAEPSLPSCDTRLSDASLSLKRRWLTSVLGCVASAIPPCAATHCTVHYRAEHQRQFFQSVMTTFERLHVVPKWACFVSQAELSSATVYIQSSKWAGYSQHDVMKINTQVTDSIVFYK